MIDMVWRSFGILEVDEVRFSAGIGGGDSVSHDRLAKRLRVADERGRANRDKGSAERVEADL